MDGLSPEARAERINKVMQSMDARDNNVPSPSQRAKFIYDKLNALEPKPTEWDLVCACAEILGQLTLDLPQLSKQVAITTRMIYEIHYYHDNDDVESCLSPANLKTSPTSPLDLQTQGDSTGEQEQSGLMIEKSQPFALD